MQNEQVPRLDVEREVDGTTVVYRLAGELDPHTAPQLTDEIDGRPEGTTTVVLDLAGVSFMDSAGIRSIIAAHEGLAGAGGVSLVLRSPSAVVKRVLEIAGLTEHLSIQ